MIPEFGEFALILAFCLAIFQTIIPIIGLRLHQTIWMNSAKFIALGQFVFVMISFGCLAYAFLTNDFSVAYVANNSNSHLPWIYRLTAVWGAHEGSLLLWVSILAFWTCAVAFVKQKITIDLRATVLAVLGMLSAGFILFLLATSSPFTRLLPQSPVEGADLNPLLQDPGLVFHPPTLYMGYVGFAVVFAFAIAALLRDRLDTSWAQAARVWAIAAWCFLTLGITMGSWWAYRVLGWGGWWFWDPVENAAFLPWLTGTALIHSLAVTEKRGGLTRWTILLSFIAFSLSLIGTFLVRSGVLISVHAFAEDPARGRFLLEFLAAVVGGALLLYAIRAPKIKATGGFTLLSRETFLLSNNIFLIIAMSTILLGTLYPLIIDALGVGKISVGPPYFNTVFIPLMTPLLILMGIGPLCYWQEMPPALLRQRLLYSMVIIVIVMTAFYLFMASKVPWGVVLGMVLASWVITSTLQTLILQKNNKTKKPLRRLLGMAFAHVGIAVCVIGITFTTYYKIDQDVSMQTGERTSVGPYVFQLLGFSNLVGPNYTGTTAHFLVTKNSKIVTELDAQKRIYTAQQMAIAVPAIDPGLFRDLYVALGEPLDSKAWSVRIYYKPFVRWIWVGGLLILTGGVLAL